MSRGRETVPRDSHEKKCFHQLTASPVCRWRENWKIAAIELSITTTPQSRIPFRRHWVITMIFKHSCSFLINHWRWDLVELLTRENTRCKGWLIASEEPLSSSGIMQKKKKKKKLFPFLLSFTPVSRCLTTGICVLPPKKETASLPDNHSRMHAEIVFNLLITFSINQLLVWSVKCQKIWKNTHYNFL